MTNNLSPPPWINGAPGNCLSVADRGLAYGDGLFETIRISCGKPALISLHWCRLIEGCKTLGIPLDISLLKAEVTAFLEANPMVFGVLKVIVTRGSGGRGYNPQGCVNPMRCLSLHPLVQRNPDPAVEGARVKPCSTRLGQSMLAGIKHLNRLEQVLARSEWQGNHWDEGLVCDFDGRLIEGTMSNLFVVMDNGLLCTPDLSRCGVAGVARQFILERAVRLGLNAEVRALEPGLPNVEEIFLCNSVNGVWPVVQYGDRHWDIGNTTIKIRDCLLEELNA